MAHRYEEQLLDWLQLIRSENVGPITFWALLDHYGSANEALRDLPNLSKRGGRAITICPRAEAIAELEAHKRQGYHLIAGFHESYPPLLQHITDAPPVISVHGVLDILHKPSFAIVGARNASLLGRQFAQQLAEEISKAGYPIVSGLARGIDRHAHLGSLAWGTVAVVAGGIDMIYPPEHQELYYQIAEKGAIISDMPLKSQPSSLHFPRRNRIISGLSWGVLVVEAALRSGSLITAQFALEQNRELFAVPGSPLDPRCRGTNDLLRQGAHLVEKGDDILRVVQNQTLPYKNATSKSYILRESTERIENEHVLKSLQQKVLTDLSNVPILIDDLLEVYQCSYSELSTVLLALELSGNVQRLVGNRVYRIY